MTVAPAVKISETKTVIRFGPNGFTLFAIQTDGAEKLAASGATARRLADYAHGAGAIECRWDFDLSRS